MIINRGVLNMTYLVVERWASIPKIAGSNLAVARQIFWPAQCVENSE